jgi:3-dehydroquinate dehydratase type I
MICVSLAEQDVDACLKKMDGFHLAEIRLDAMPAVTLEDVARIFSTGPRLVATCRPNTTLTTLNREDLLRAAIEAGATMVDVEWESPTDYKNRLIQVARTHACQVIVSHHDFDFTPPRPRLREIIDQCFAQGADVVKVACMVKQPADAARLLGLLDDRRRIVVVGLGPQGVMTRIAAPFLGSPLAFASFDGKSQTAPGQLDHQTLATLLAKVAEVQGAG